MSLKLLTVGSNIIELNALESFRTVMTVVDLEYFTGLKKNKIYFFIILIAKLCSS